MTHYTATEMTTMRNNGYVITGDRNIAVMAVSVKYNITDAVTYALNVANIDKIINASVSNAMVESAAHISVDSLLTTGKEDFAREVKQTSQNTLDTAKTGITISTVELTNVSMPAEVKETYDLVNSATVQAATMLEQAKQYRENLIPQAEATANSLISEANARYSTTLADARIQNQSRRRAYACLHFQGLGGTCQNRQDTRGTGRRKQDNNQLRGTEYGKYR